MKKLIAVILAAAMLLTMFTGCSKDDNAGDVLSLTSYSIVHGKYCGYFPSFDYPTDDGLPMMKAAGAVSLKDSFAENEEKFRPLLEEFAAEPDFQKRCEITEKILLVLCDAEGGAEEISDGEGSFSERKLTVLRKFWSEDQELAAVEVPEPQSEDEVFFEMQTHCLENAYEALVPRCCLSLICSLGYNNISYIRKYTDSSGTEYPYMGFFNRHLCYSPELGEMTELEFCDSVMAMTVYGIMELKSPRMAAEFYAYVEEQALPGNDEAAKKCLELTQKVLELAGEVVRDTDRVYIALGNDYDNERNGWDHSDLLAGGKGSDVLEGKLGDDFLIGGEGDDYYVINAGDGCDTIYDCGGRNEIIFRGISDVYAVGFSEDEFKDDVKLFFGDEYVIIKNFLADRSVHFDIEINGKRIEYDSPENPLSDIHEPGYVPDTAARPVG